MGDMKKEALRLYKKITKRGKFYDEDVKSSYKGFLNSSKKEQQRILKNLYCYAGENQEYNKEIEFYVEKFNKNLDI